MTSRFRTPARTGFTMLEIIIAVSIVAILAAAAVPVTTKVLTYQIKKATREELQVLAGAASEYFRDNLAFPKSIHDLLVNPGKKVTPSWSGSYLPDTMVDPKSKSSSYEIDGWARSYQVAAVGDVLTITSQGPDAAGGTDDDLSIDVDVTHVRRELTLDRLKTINQAIHNYNALYQTTAPLPAKYTSVYSALVSKKFLPAAGEYQTDAWGAAYKEDPPGKAPVVKVGSVNLVADTSATAQAAEKNKGKGKGKSK